MIGGSSGIGTELVKNLSETVDHVFATYYTHSGYSDRQKLKYNYLDVLSEQIDFDY